MAPAGTVPDLPKPGGRTRCASPILDPMTAPAFRTAPRYEIRARHAASTVTVYQAYTPFIGLPAARDGRLPAAWKRDRMTWIIKRR